MNNQNGNRLATPPDILSLGLQVLLKHVMKDPKHINSKDQLGYNPILLAAALKKVRSLFSPVLHTTTTPLLTPLSKNFSLSFWIVCFNRKESR